MLNSQLNILFNVLKWITQLLKRGVFYASSVAILLIFFYKMYIWNMKRRKAVQTIALGVGGLGLLTHCNSTASAPPVLDDKDQQIVGLLTEAILPSKTEAFPTPETRMQFVLNQIDGALTSEELKGYKQGLTIFKGLVEQTFFKPYEDLDFDTQNYTIERALGHPGQLGFFMQKNRQWSMRHFMTSERYMNEFLNYEFIPNRYLGCILV